MNVVVLGAGESGIGAALLALKNGYKVFVTDNGKIKEKYRDVLLHAEIDWEEEGHDLDRVLQADLVIKSPGIPDSVAVVKQCVEKGIEVISEIEFAYRLTKATIIGITGSNGKTTTSMWLYDMMRRAGLKVMLAGNVGRSFAASVANDDADYYVLELSSFQLDGIVRFKPHIAILMNITPDHLDRYESFTHYADSKFRITLNQDEEDYFIYCADDEAVLDGLERHHPLAHLIPFSINQAFEEGAYITNEELIINHNNKQFKMSIFELALQGKHNQYNSMASGIAAKILELRKEVIRESLSDFQNVEHRLEYVAKVYGIDFINDSKATNVNSTWYALESMTKPVVWIAGGVDKGNDYSALLPLVQEKVKAIVCLGLDNQKLHTAFGDIVPQMVDVTSADEAVKQAYQLGTKGDVVLLSPCCASFDLFESFEDRGHQFKMAVRSL